MSSRLLFGLDYYTTAVRTGGEGMSGVSVLLIEKVRDGHLLVVRNVHSSFARR